MTTSNETTLQPLTSSERKRMFDLIYKRTHADFKGLFGPDVARHVISWAHFGGGLSSEVSMSDEEMRKRYSELLKQGPRRA